MSEGEVTFRIATRADLSAIVHLLADDELGSKRERYEEPLPEAYERAFDQIRNDPNHELIVAELGGELIGTLHLMFLPSVSYQGKLRAQIGSVRVGRKYRSLGIGSKMLSWAIERARARHAYVVQLTTHKSREDAHRFYERLGFEGLHLGMKLNLK